MRHGVIAACVMWLCACGSTLPQKVQVYPPLVPGGGEVTVVSLTSGQKGLGDACEVVWVKSKAGPAQTATTRQIIKTMETQVEFGMYAYNNVEEPWEIYCNDPRRTPQAKPVGIVVVRQPVAVQTDAEEAKITELAKYAEGLEARLKELEKRPVVPSRPTPKVFEQNGRIPPSPATVRGKQAQNQITVLGDEVGSLRREVGSLRTEIAGKANTTSVEELGKQLDRIKQELSEEVRSIQQGAQKSFAELRAGQNSVLQGQQSQSQRLQTVEERTGAALRGIVEHDRRCWTPNPLKLFRKDCLSEEERQELLRQANAPPANPSTGGRGLGVTFTRHAP